MTINGTSLPPWYKGKGMHELPEPERCSRDRSRINLAKAAGS
jgi:hypothetical protein